MSKIQGTERIGQSSLRIIVTGLITQHPLLGGITWHYLQYMLGLARLGHDVYYFEDSGEFPYNVDGGASGTDWIAPNCTDNIGYLAKIMTRFGFENRWAYHFPLTFSTKISLVWSFPSTAGGNHTICRSPH
jgi:hypothetical protein